MDRLPDAFLRSDNAERLDLDSPRHLASSDAAEYWSVLSREGKLCLIVSPHDEDFVAGTCLPTAQFEESGIWLAMQQPSAKNSGIVSYLLPEKVSGASTPVGAVRVAPTILEVHDVDGSVPCFSISAGDVQVKTLEVSLNEE